MIQIMKPKMPNTRDLIPYLEEIDSTGIYSNFGPLSKKLVARLGVYFNIDPERIVPMANATLALQAAIEFWSSSGASRNLLIPSWTFTASVGAGLMARQDVTFADVDSSWRVVAPDDWDFVVDVLPFGENLRLQNPLRAEWQVIDAAASFDALKNMSDHQIKNSIIVLSMHATKLLGAGEGGICIAPTAEIARALKSWSNFGFQDSRNSAALGTNSKLSEYSSAVALASLDNWGDTREKLSELQKSAVEISNSLNLQVISSMTNGYVSPYWIVNFPDKESRNRAELLLNANLIETRKWWENGCHLMPAYGSIPMLPLENTEFAASTSLGLPFHYYLKSKDLDKIHQVLSALA